MTRNGWQKKKVKELCDVGRGRVISSEEINNNLDVYPVFSSQTANKGEMGRIKTYDFDGEYVTWTTDGAYAGTVFYRSGKFNCTNVCGTLKAKSDSLSMVFLAYLLSTSAKDYVSYVGNPKLMNNVMAEISLALPSMSEEQAQIAAVLSCIDRAIEHTEALIAKQQRIKTGLMQDLLTKGIDEHGNIRSEAIHEFKDSPLGRIPKEWSIGSINDLAMNLDGRRKPVKQEDRDKMRGVYPYYGASGIIDWVDNYIFDGEYVLLGEDGENVLSRRLPLAFRVAGKLWVNNHAHIYEPLPNTDVRYLAELLDNGSDRIKQR